jgi:2-iminoacetate synthase
MTQQQTSDWLNAGAVDDILHSAVRDDGRIREVLQKARELKGLDMADVAALCHIAAPEQIEELFATARRVKEEIYGHRMVLFAPLYISNVCGNECTYCAFRASNKALKRTALDMEGIKRDTAELVRQGHKRLLLVAGEGYSAANGGFRYVLDAIAAVYDVTDASGNIRRLNVNLAPFDVDEFRQLKQAGIGTYQLFQETYHRPTYAAVHTVGKKRDYDWRATALDRAMQAGIDDVGMGVLFGLHDWRFELLSLMQHIAHLEEVFGVGCHTISVPRIEPADGSGSCRWRRRRRSAISTSRRSSPSCGSPCPTPGSSCRRANRRRSGANATRSASRRSRPAAGPIPAAIAVRNRLPDSSSSATTARSTRSCMNCRRWASSPRSVRRVTGSAVPGRISWISPSPA